MRPRGILETCLYCPDLDTADAFYRDVFGLERITRKEDRHVFFRCGDGVLLLFNPARTAEESTSIDGASVPSHGTTGPGHIAFSVSPSDIDRWRERFVRNGVPIESEVRWPGGGQSIYVRDPAGNSIEVATPDLWGL
jgi:catechol 2,3-dioxygenase-like lactoylglutathione lyase family enzyme